MAKNGQFAWYKFSLFKFRMMWQPFFFFSMPFLRSHLDRLVFRAQMSHFQGLQRPNLWRYIDFCPVGLLNAKIWVKSIILRKVPKRSRKYFFFENFKKYSPKDWVKSYSELVVNPCFSLQMCILWWHNEYQLCKNSPCHENKKALKISRWGTYFDKLKKAAACCPHKCNFRGQHVALFFKLSPKVPHLEIFNTASQVKNWQFSQNMTCDSALKCDMWQINYDFLHDMA